MAFIEEKRQPDITCDGLGERHMGVQMHIVGDGGIGDDRALQMGGRGQREFSGDKGRPIVGRRDFGGATAAVDPSDRVDLKCQLVPEEVALGIGPIGVKGGVADRSKGARVDGEGVDETAVVLGQLFGQLTCRRTVSTLVRCEVFEQNVLWTVCHRLEAGRFGLAAVANGQRDDRIIDDVATRKGRDGHQ